MNNSEFRIEGVTPATLRVAVAFILGVVYFAGEIYFWGSEYYAGSAPYGLIAIVSLVLSFFAYQYLRKKEPDRTDAKTYAALACIGFAVFSYALILRLNILTDDSGLQDYAYQLDAFKIWQNQQGAPALDLYMPSSEYWQQYRIGDKATFQLRQGGLGIWQVNMDQIYERQKRFYDCDGVLSCLLVITPLEAE